MQTLHDFLVSTGALSDTFESNKEQFTYTDLEEQHNSLKYNSLKYCKTLSVPNAKNVDLAVVMELGRSYKYECKNLTHIDAPNAIELTVSGHDALKSINAPKTQSALLAQLINLEKLNIEDCKELNYSFQGGELLKRIHAPNLQDVTVDNEYVLYMILRQIKSPLLVKHFEYKLRSNDDDGISSRDIHNAYEELNRSTLAAEHRNNIVLKSIKNSRPKKDENLEKNFVDEFKKSGISGTIGEFLNQGDVCRIKYLSRKGLDAIKGDQNLSTYANPDNIVAETKKQLKIRQEAEKKDPTLKQPKTESQMKRGFYISESLLR